MFKRILVPTDGSDLAGGAVTGAIELARTHGASLVALHVFEPLLVSHHRPGARSPRQSTLDPYKTLCGFQLSKPRFGWLA